MSRFEETAPERIVLAAVNSGEAAAGVFPAEDLPEVQVVHYLFLDIFFEDGSGSYLFLSEHFWQYAEPFLVAFFRMSCMASASPEL